LFLLLQKNSGNPVKQTETSGKEVGPNAAGKVVDIRSMNTGTEGLQEVASTLEKKISRDLALSSPKYAPTSTQKPAVAVKQTSPLVAPPQNRFKLDNRTTSFRILPPLPPEIANVSRLPNLLPFHKHSSMLSSHNRDQTLKFYVYAGYPLLLLPFNGSTLALY
jgi:RNA-binding protein 26